MILAVDAGNTTVSICLIEEGTVFDERRLLTEEARTPVFKRMISDFLSETGKQFGDIENAVLSSVVLSLTPFLVSELENTLHKTCFVVQPGITVGMKILYDIPASVGSDRIANSYALRTIYGYPSVCIDFGTATTFCVLNSTGDFAGGVIIPGIKVFGAALHDSASRLPEVMFAPVENVIGQSTTQNLQSGFFFGYIDMIQGLLYRMEQQMGHPLRVIATGGYGSQITPLIPGIDVYDGHLTFKGLEMLYKLNQKPQLSHCWGGGSDSNRRV
ncbi:type III pantothenate kinase [bacterium]|nr:type III pantothenate kinase [candidate division CSSED10-310 bacterium]